MKKMQTLFFKNAKHKAIDDVQCLWVYDDSQHVTAHIKHDGTACMILDGQLYKRYDAKLGRGGKRKIPPEGAIPCCNADEVTGHWPHWVKCDDFDKWHMEAFSDMLKTNKTDGTYELVGPKINGNHDRHDKHCLVSHETHLLVPKIRTFDQWREFMSTFRHEGVVFHHKDGRMCKLRRKDFGFDWPIAG